LRVGLVLNNTPTYSETFFNNKINSLLKAGFEVKVFSIKSNKVPANWEVISPYPLPDNNIKRSLLLAPVLLWLFLRAPKAVNRFINLEKTSGNSWKKILENLYINAHILSQKLDWLHFGFATTAIRRENTAAAIGAKMAVSLRGYDIAVYPLKNPGCYKLLWKRIDKVHTISDDLLTLAHHFGLDNNKTAIKITPAIDFKKFHVDGHNASPRLKILTVARLNWKKGLSYSLHAMKILKDKGIDFQYTIIGDGTEKKSLVFEAYQLGISENVVFAGVVASDKITAYYRENGIYLQPSVQEGFCNSVLEAQAAGLLCIVTDAEGLQENVLDKVTGWVVPKRDPKSMAAAIETVWRMAEIEKNTVINGAQERIRNEFNIEKQTGEFIAFYS
jgi:colanic acid/amylovoran biosynthesis glycosyltransferase